MTAPDRAPRHALGTRAGALLAAGLAALALGLGWFATHTSEAPRESRVPGASLDGTPATHGSGPAPELEAAAANDALSAAKPPTRVTTHANAPALARRSSATSEIHQVPVHVRVVDRSGVGPMPGMGVEPWVGEDAPPSGARSMRRGRSDAAGSVTFELARNRGAEFVLGARVAQEGWASSVVRFELQPGEALPEGPIELVVRPELACWLTVSVYDTNGKLATQGSVTHTIDRMEERDGAQSFPLEELSRYELDGEGPLGLEVPSERFHTLIAGLPDGSTDRKRISTEGGVSRAVALRPLKSGGLAGRIVDLNGNGLSGFSVHAYDPATYSEHPWNPNAGLQFARTISGGSFWLSDLPSRPVLLMAQVSGRSGLGRWPLPEPAVLGNTQEATYTLPLTRLAVSAWSPEGRPIPLRSGSLTVDGPSGTPPCSIAIVRGGAGGWIHSAWFESSRGAATAASPTAASPTGPAFRLPRLPNNFAQLVEAGHSYRIELLRWDAAPHVEELWVPPAGLSDEQRIVLAPPEPAVAVELVLTEPGGEALQGTTQWIISRRLQRAVLTLRLPDRTDASVRLELRPGTYRVLAIHRSESLPVVARTVKGEIQVTRAGPFRFELSTVGAREHGSGLLSKFPGR